MSYKTAIEAAFQAAQEAEIAFMAQYGEPFYCGFAWVNIKPGTSKLARELVATGEASKSYYGGVDVWNPGKSLTQSMDIKEAGARAFAKTLRDLVGDAKVSITPMSRAD